MLGFDLPGHRTGASAASCGSHHAPGGQRGGIDTSVVGIRRLQDLRRRLLGPPELRAAG